MAQVAGYGPGALFQLLRDGQARTRSELADLTGLARSTIAARVDLLLTSGLIRAAGSGTSTGGRPPSRIEFNPGAGAVFAIDLGATHASVAITDLGATVLDIQHLRLRIDAGPESVLDRCLATLAELLAANRALEGVQLAGIGIGVPGPVEHSTGRPINPPIMPGWNQFDIPHYIQQRYPVPVLVDNDVNILALGEHALSWFTARDLVFVKVATGIGAGIISGGEIQRGAAGGAGDLGHVQVPYSKDSPRPPEDERDLEAIASGTAIAESLRERGLDAPDSAAVVKLLNAGNTDAIMATRQAGREVGEVLATVVNLLNPSIIVIGGSIARAGEHLLAGIREVVYRRSITLATQHLAIVQSQAGDSAGALGAAIMVSRHVLTEESVESMLDPGRLPTRTDR
ncbi:ROK family protein [Microbacterium sp.]|uniref:ROK family protein n=1 Tax=Microbacterium sp. TaxID=51671 RepID=UPI0028124769|nr:ROK family protein [Microbacterium sp.]